MTEFYPRVMGIAGRGLRDADPDVRGAAAESVRAIARSVPLVSATSTPAKVAERAAAVLLTPLFALLAEKNAKAQDGAARALKGVFLEAGVVLHPASYPPRGSSLRAGGGSQEPGGDDAGEDEPDGLGVVRGSVLSRTVTRLLSALRSSDVEAKAAVAEALGALVEAVPEGVAQRAEQIVLASEELLLSPDWSCRKAGAEVLHVCALWIPVCAGEFAPEIITLLAPLKHDKMRPVRDAAQAALETFATQDVVAYAAPATSPVARALSARQRHRVALAKERGRRSASGADRADEARQRTLDARQRQFLKKRREDDGIMAFGWEEGGAVGGAAAAAELEDERGYSGSGSDERSERRSVGKGGRGPAEGAGGIKDDALLLELRGLIGELRGELKSAHRKIEMLERGRVAAEPPPRPQPSPSGLVGSAREAKQQQAKPSRPARRRRSSLTIEFVGVALEPPEPEKIEEKNIEATPCQPTPSQPTRPSLPKTTTVVVVPPMTPWEQISSALGKGDVEASFVCALEDGGTDETLIRLIGRTTSAATPLFVTLSPATASRLLLRVAALLRGKYFLHHLLPLVRQAAVHMPKVPLAVLREVASAVEESVSDVTRLPGLSGEALAKTANQVHGDLLRAILNAYNTEIARERERATRVQVV